MDVSRQTAVRAGFHFPFYVFQDTIFGEGQRFGHTKECQELKDYYASCIPAEMRAIFVNPSFSLQDVTAAYRKYPGSATQQEELWLNEQLHKALYGLPDYVYRWFRLGQACVGLGVAATSGRRTFPQELGALLQIASACGLREPELTKLQALFQGIQHVFSVHKGANPFEVTGSIAAVLSEIAVNEDLRLSSISKGSPTMKLLTLAVLLAAGLFGFHILEAGKAIMWLLFVVIAIPPLLAVMFESEKLSGPNIVDLYKVGLKGLPLLGKLFGGSER